MVKNATKFWICEKVKDWLIEDATLGAKELMKKIKEHHKVSSPYKRVWDGGKLALKELYGDWDSSFDNLFRFKSQVKISCPGSVYTKIWKKNRRDSKSSQDHVIKESIACRLVSADKNATQELAFFK